MQKGDAIHESDTVTTARDASAQIRMRDGGLIAVRPDSRLKIDNFVFNGEQDGTENSIFTLLKGGMRAITGLIGKLHKEKYHIYTASTAIGIRGTDHEVYVVVPGSEMAAKAPVGTYDRVNSGETVMTTDKGSVNILPNQMGYSAGMDQVPQLQPVNLNLFTAVPPPSLQGDAAKGAAGNGATDGAMQGQDMAPADTGASNPPAQNPIIQDRGPTAPPRVF